MPSGLKRFQRAESLHFVTFSCFHRLPLLEAQGARETVEAVLEPTRARHQARVYAYVLMPEHVHLLVNEPPRIVLAQFLKAVKQMTSRKLRGPRQKFWQDRYYDSNVRGEKARSEVIRYIHRNPVERGLVTHPEDWPWSSFRHYAIGVKGTVEIESQWTAFLRGNQLPESLRYREGPIAVQGNPSSRSSQFYRAELGRAPNHTSRAAPQKIITPIPIISAMQAQWHQAEFLLSRTTPARPEKRL